MPDHSFDPVAPFYDALATLVFGKALRQSQNIFLRAIPPGSRILIIGGGSGLILEEIFKNTKNCEIVYLEASPKMLQSAREKIKEYSSPATVEFRLGTETAIATTEKFEVIITHFFLDLFAPEPLNSVSDILFNALKPNGRWLATDFVQPSGYSFKSIGAKILYESMYLFFRVTCRISATSLPDWQKHLSQYKLTLSKSAYFYGGLIKAVLLIKNCNN